MCLEFKRQHSSMQAYIHTLLDTCTQYDRHAYMRLYISPYCMYVCMYVTEKRRRFDRVNVFYDVSPP